MSQNFKEVLKISTRNARIMRIYAKLIDFAIAIFITLLFYPIGTIFSFIFLSIIDSAHNGESVGKKILGFRVIKIQDGKPCGIKESVIRNSLISFPFLFLAFPIWGWILFILLILPTLTLEIYFIMQLDSFYRLGDVISETTVIANDPNIEISKRSNKNKLNSNFVFE